MSKAQFKDTGFNAFGSRNSILRGEKFWISYNADTRNSVFGSWFAGDGTGEETALVKDGKYRILNGDWRSEYSALLPSWEACLAFFEAHRKEHGSSYTSDGV